MSIGVDVRTAISRLLVLAAMTLSALASEFGGVSHRCVWISRPRKIWVENDVRKFAS